MIDGGEDKRWLLTNAHSVEYHSQVNSMKAIRWELDKLRQPIMNEGQVTIQDFKRAVMSQPHLAP